MKTMVCRRRPAARASRLSATNCAAISAAERLRSKRDFAVAQKSQPIAQPTCDEMQPATRQPAGVGISTDSTVRPSASRSSNLTVPSPEC